jgi:hypothetical protein
VIALRIVGLAGAIVFAPGHLTTAPTTGGFTAIGTGSASARVSVLPVPKRPEITVLLDGTVAVHWTLTRWASGDDVPGYEVEAVGVDGPPTVVCTVLAPVTDCTDPTGPTGPVRYQVRSMAGLWRSAPSPLSAPATPVVAATTTTTTSPTTTTPAP